MSFFYVQFNTLFIRSLHDKLNLLGEILYAMAIINPYWKLFSFICIGGGSGELFMVRARYWLPGILS